MNFICNYRITAPAVFPCYNLTSERLNRILCNERYVVSRGSEGDAPDFVELGEAGIAMDDAMRRQRRVQLVG